MTRRSVIDLLKRPEWYSAMYSLTAHRSHAALEPDAKETDKHTERARKEALLLALGCVAMIARHDVKPPWPEEEALKALDAELFPGPGTPVDVQPRTPPRARLPKRYSVRPKRRDPLPDFLKTTVEPSALTLLAAIVAAIHKTEGERPEAEAATRETLLTELTAAVKKPDALDPDRLIATVTDREPIDGRARYNLACYYAQTAGKDRKRLERARAELELAVRTTRGVPRRAMVAWAWKDPALRSALADWDEAEDVLGPRPKAEGKDEAPELERISAIGGYTGALAGKGIHGVEQLRSALSTPAGLNGLARDLELERDMVILWRDLLRLLKVEGIGPAQLNLLEAAGVTSASALRGIDADVLHRRLTQVNKARRLVDRVPSVKTLAEWKKQATRLRRWIRRPRD